MQNELKQVINSYQTSTKSRDLLGDVNLVIIVSITGGGKNTVIKEMLKTGKYHYVISHTTRNPRQNQGVAEQNGINYWFVSEEEMLKKLQNGEFVEAKWVHDSYVYGTSIDELMLAKDSNKTALLEIDVQGVEEILRVKPDTKVIFLVPPSYDIWLERLDSRGNMPEEERSQRFQTAKTELQTALNNDYFKFVINNEIDQTLKQVEDVVAGREATSNAKEVARSILESLA